MSDVAMPQNTQLYTSYGNVLTPLIDALNWQGSEDRLHQSMIHSFDRMTLNDLIETMANLNFGHDRIKSVKGRHIDQGVLPALYITRDKVLLILGMDGNDFLIYDADQGIYTNESLKAERGDLFLFKYVGDRDDSLLKTQNNWFTKLMIRFKKSLLQLTGITLLMTLLDLVVPIIVMMLYDQISSVSGLKGFLLLLLAVSIYFFATMSFGYIRGTIINYISVRMGNIISHQTFRRLMYLSPHYTETTPVSSQISRIKDFENLKRFTNSVIFSGVLELTFSVIYIIAIFVLGGWIGVIPIVTFIVVIALGLIMRPFHKVNMEGASEARNQWQQHLIELLRNGNDIKTSGIADHWLRRAEQLSGKSILQSYKQSKVVFLSNSLAYFLTNGSVVVLVYGGVNQVFDGHMTTGALIGSILLYWKVLSSIRSSFSLSVQINGLKRTIQQINRFMKLPQDNHYQSNKSSINHIKGSVQFKNVSLRYNQGSDPALISAEFSVGPGEIFGISGHDGSGKSTIFKIILGMYNPQVGRVTLDGQNIKQFEPLVLRQSIAYSSDRDMIFTGTIRENFKYFSGSVTDDEIMDAITTIGLASYMIRYDFKLDTYLDEQMVNNLSPSFKKLFCLARMLTRKVNLYLLDEPENFLTPNELERVMMVIRDLSKYQGATVMIASQNDKILKMCHRTTALNQGRMRERKVSYE